MPKINILLTVLVLLTWPFWYLVDLPDTSVLLTKNPSEPAIRVLRERQITARGGTPNSLMHWRELNKISPHLIQAVVLAEDDTFFHHHGFDFEQLKKAFRENWKRRRFAFGASTISQQLARTLYLSSNKNLFRKLKEALITRRLEKTLSKNRILELYLNVVEWGPQVYGAEAASQYFFMKPASDLTVDEAISLAVILPSPWRWKPVAQTKFMTQRKAEVYERMVRARYIPVAVSTETAVAVSTDTVISPESVVPTETVVAPQPNEEEPEAEEAPIAPVPIVQP